MPTPKDGPPTTTVEADASFELTSTRAAIHQFESTLDAIRELVRTISPTIDKMDADSRRFRRLVRAIDDDQLNTFWKQLSDAVNAAIRQAEAKGSNKITLTLNETDLQEEFGESAKVLTDLVPFFLRGRPGLTPPKGEILYGSLLTVTVSAFEVLIAALFAEHYRLHPDALDAGDRKFSLTDLRAFSTIGDAEEAAIADRVDEHMRDPLEDWLRWFERNTRCRFSDLAVDWDSTQEIFQRRHVIVHNAGRVSRQYVSKVPGTTRKVGQALRVSERYLLTAIDQLLILGYLLGHETWLKWRPTDAGVVGQALLSRSYRALKEDQWIVAEQLARRACNIKTDETIVHSLRCNQWLAIKRQGRLHEIEKDIQSWDVSALDPLFALAKYALLDDIDRALNLLPQCLTLHPDWKGHLTDWPLLHELRQDPRSKPFLRRGKRRKGEPVPVVLRTPPGDSEAADTPNGPTETDNGSQPELALEPEAGSERPGSPDHAN